VHEQRRFYQATAKKWASNIGWSVQLMSHWQQLADRTITSDKNNQVDILRPTCQNDGTPAHKRNFIDY